jgi:hypothetical protein
MSHNVVSHLNTVGAPCVCARDNWCGATPGVTKMVPTLDYHWRTNMVRQ